MGTGQPDALGSNMSALPLGVEIGRHVDQRVLVSVALAYRPGQDSSQTLASAGVRVYLRAAPLAPYLAGVVGFIKEQIPDATRTETNPFAMVGPGLELETRNGFSLTTDFLLGAENKGDGPDRSWATSWHLSAFYRLGVGFRF